MSDAVLLGEDRLLMMQSFEQSALMLIAEGLEEGELLRSQVAVADVVDRDFSGTGFFSTFRVPDDVERLSTGRTANVKLNATFANVAHGMGLVLFVTPDGRIDFLEGFTYGEYWDPSYLPALTVVRDDSEMPTNILMPALSPTMEAGKLAKWLKKEGDAIKSGDAIAEIETDKATMEVEAVDEGRLGKILIAEGTEDVPVNQPIAILLEEGEDASAVSATAAAAPKAEAKAAPAPEVKSEPAPAPKAPAPKAEAAPAPKAGLAPKGNGHDGGRVFASPLARRIAGERGIDLSDVAGTGPHGRIIKVDVEGFSGQPKPAQAKKAPAGEGVPLQGPSDDEIRSLFEPGSYDVVPHDGMRRVIARRMQQSKVVVPHYYLAVDVDLDALLTVREEMNAAAPKGEDGKPTYKLSLNDFVIRALALTLQKHPEANASWTEDGMLRHKKVDIGVAVAIKDGLITPIIRAAETKSVSQISREMVELATRARNKRLKPHEYQGGTTAISNLGMYGVKHFTAVVNPPHSTILAVSAGEKRAVVRDDKIVIATQMTVTISCDHRVLDGAQSAEMMQSFKGFIEKPMRLLM